MIYTYNAERDGLYTTIYRCLRDYRMTLPTDFLAYCIGRDEDEVAAAVAQLRDDGVVAVTGRGVVLAPREG